MALDLDCPTCQTEDHVALVKSLTGTQKRLRCERCGYQWLRREPAPQRVTMPTLARSGRSFPHYNSTHPNPDLKSALEPFALIGT